MYNIIFILQQTISLYPPKEVISAVLYITLTTTNVSCFMSFLLDLLGSTVFAPIKADIAGNITVSAIPPPFGQTDGSMNQPRHHISKCKKKLY